MRKLLQMLVLIGFSLSLISCGGSSGSDGSKGADGTVSTPTQSGTLAISFSDADDTIDNNTGLGIVTHGFTLSGTDNVSGSSTTRYYFYEGEASSGRDLAADLTAATATSSASLDVIAITAEDASTTTVVDALANALDTRMKPTGHDNYTVTLTGYLTGTLTASAAGSRVIDNGSVDWLTVCPGNPGGDTTASCATQALKDRGSRGQVNLDTDNDLTSSDSRAFILPQNSASGHAFYLMTDNMSHYRIVKVTESKGGDNATVESHLAETFNNKNPVSIPSHLDVDNITDAVVGSTTIYLTTVSEVDNGSILIKSVDSDGTLENYDNVSADNGDNISDRFMLAWDIVGGKLYGAGVLHGGTGALASDNQTVQTYLLDGSSAHFSDNFTLDNISGIANDGAEETNQLDSWCFAAGSPKWSGSAAANVLLGARLDNGTWALMTDNAADGTGMNVSSNFMTGTHTLMDNSTGGINVTDNLTAIHCDIAWNFSVSSSSQTGQDNGTIHFAFLDNGSAVRVGIIAQDNTTTEIGGVLQGVGSGTITDIEVGVDSGDNKTVLAVVKGGEYFLLKENGASDDFDLIIESTTVDGSSPDISLSVSPDGSAYAVVVDGASDNATLKIFYDE